MDRLESLGSALSQITLYDIKSMVNQAKNVVFNVSEMEAKVRDATNDEPWGASSTLMQEIAQGYVNHPGHHAQNFNEIMPAIYSRFMEKEARQWRQIYKALQLLEYLVKNGSERVVDDARSHIATIKMLRNFYYVDDKGKDQGINVRNRSKELVELLGDVEKIRGERRKAKANRSKYIGVGNDPTSYGSGGGSRYGGFGSESLGYGGSYSGSYGGGGGGSSSHYDSYGEGGSGSYSGGFRDSTSRRQFQEYDAGDDDVVSRRSNSVSISGSHSATSAPQRSSTLSTATAPEPKGKQPEVDLLGMDDDAFSSAPSAPADKALPALGAQSNSLVGGDDDFDDFQSAPPSAVPVSATPFLNSAAGPAQSPQTPLQPQVPAGNSSLFNMLSAPNASAAPARTPYMSPPAVSVQNPMQNVLRPAMATSPPPAMTSPPPMMASQTPLVPSHGIMSPTSPPPRSTATSPAVAAATSQHKASAASFDDLWSMSLGSSSSVAGKSGGATGSTQQKSIKDLEKEKAQAQIWGQRNKPPAGAGFGSFSGTPGASNAAPPASPGNALDDLLF
ncbi:hypothetical protein BD413DRAFT_642400 [Trametes elegans]|nr:hypothetical protein BD413DRAFT_642400 [Trametes elegans]